MHKSMVIKSRLAKHQLHPSGTSGGILTQYDWIVENTLFI
uniref:Uncharacterized protein n=1 Tax=Rhizophora mucronata TaxID=61149 RepID=A0A2P2QTZ4_RHIMU